MVRLVIESGLILPGATQAPRLTTAQAQQLVAEHWGIEGAVAAELGSYQDQVFRIDAGSGEAAGRFALKVANSATGRAVLEMEHAVLRALPGRLGALQTPEPAPATSGAEIVDAGPYLARLLTWVAGEPLAQAGYIDDARAAMLGDAAGRLSAALSTVEHPGAHRPLQWDVRQTAAVADLARDVLTDDEWAMQQRALGWLAGVDDGALPQQIAYTDVTANNLLGDLAADGTFTPTAIVDFGDLVHTWRIADLVGAAHAAIAGDPARALELATVTLAAFHARQPLTPAEADAFWPVLAARAALSVASSAHQLRRGEAPPGAATGAYLDTFAARDREALRAVLDVDPVLARAAARTACGLPPCTAGAHAAVEQIAALQPGPLIDGLGPARLHPVDLSVRSPYLVEGRWDSSAGVAEALAEALAEATAGGTIHDGGTAERLVAVGRWGEARLVGAGRPTQDARDALHLGADLFVAPGATVLAPFDVRVLTATPTSLELESTAGARAPIVRLAGLAPAVAAGAELARGAVLGHVAEAVDAAPLPAHLHVQLATAAGVPAAGATALRAAWLAISPDPSPLLGVDVAAPGPAGAAEQVERRGRHVAGAQELYYRAPQEIVRGWKQYLYDASGRPYVDMVNNVASIGHSHPAVAEAAARQFRLLNTNSRFLYDAMAEYAEAITQTLPPHLDTVFFVNSGSEAVDLAVRLARAATGRHELLAIDGAYHGWTGSVFEFCTHPQDNPHWRETIPPWVHPVVQPHPYRGALGTDAAPYVASVREQCAAAAARGGVAAFVAEPMLGNQGAVSPPPGYVAEAFDVVREHGGVCIADEIQVGYGRTGATFWAFEFERAEPDIVTAAKAVGNGHPLGFVACRREIADAFGARAPWFSSPGGGAVSCRVGLAVLQTIQREGLQQNAAVVGARLRERLEALADDHPIIGRVNGRGLYMGVDLVRDRATMVPAPGEASAICERLRRFGVILQPTGDHGNVLKVKPPLCLTEADADDVVAALARVLEERASEL